MKISFQPKCDEKTIDLIWPRGGIKDYIKPGTTSHIMTLRRRDPFVQDTEGGDEIGKLDTVLEWKPHKDQDFKMERLAASARGQSSTVKAGANKGSDPSTTAQ